MHFVKIAGIIFPLSAQSLQNGSNFCIEFAWGIKYKISPNILRSDVPFNPATIIRLLCISTKSVDVAKRFVKSCASSIPKTSYWSTSDSNSVISSTFIAAMKSFESPKILPVDLTPSVDISLLCVLNADEVRES